MSWRQWYAFDVLTHNRIGPLWTRSRAADVASDMQEHLMFMDTNAAQWNNSERWITVNIKWMQERGVF